MLRRPPLALGGLGCHVLNPHVGRPPLFEKSADSAACEKISAEAYGRTFTTWPSAWPIDRPRKWAARVNRPRGVSEREALRISAQRGWPKGS